MANVYVLYTGGTIGCSGRPLKPANGPDFFEMLARAPGLSGGKVAGRDGLTYTLDWLAAPKDSADIGPAEWLAIARRVLERYAEFDGFVILHGTDTMAATASALSFMLPGLSKPLILTGSMLPLCDPLSDGPANMGRAIILAGTAPINECALYFGTRLLRGNRAVKNDCSRHEAFGSPNFPPLAEAGGDFRINERNLRPPPTAAVTLGEPVNRDALRSRLKNVERRIETFSALVLALHPGMRASGVRALLNDSRPPAKAVIIEALGAGNAPGDAALLGALKAASEAGAVLGVTSRSVAGRVDLGAYAAGSSLAAAGAVGLGDMTTDAALAKLIWLLGQGLSAPEAREALTADLAGEMTPP